MPQQPSTSFSQTLLKLKKRRLLASPKTKNQLLGSLKLREVEIQVRTVRESQESQESQKKGQIKATERNVNPDLITILNVDLNLMRILRMVQRNSNISKALLTRIKQGRRRWTNSGTS